MDESGYDAEEERALEVMAAARRLFEDGDRFGGGWFDRQRRSGRITIFVCAIAPTSEEVESLDGIAAETDLPLTVVPVKYSMAQLLDNYDRLAGRDLPEGSVSWGVDPTHNALRFVLRRVDEDIVSYLHEHVPPDALWVEIEPRAGHAVAFGDAQDPLGA
jgi:hypothetical protein